MPKPEGATNKLACKGSEPTHALSVAIPNSLMPWEAALQPWTNWNNFRFTTDGAKSSAKFNHWKRMTFWLCPEAMFFDCAPIALCENSGGLKPTIAHPRTTRSQSSASKRVSLKLSEGVNLRQIIWPDDWLHISTSCLGGVPAHETSLLDTHCNVPQHLEHQGAAHWLDDSIKYDIEVEGRAPVLPRDLVPPSMRHRLAAHHQRLLLQGREVHLDAAVDQGERQLHQGRLQVVYALGARPNASPTRAHNDLHIGCVAGAAEADPSLHQGLQELARSHALIDGRETPRLAAQEAPPASKCEQAHRRDRHVGQTPLVKGAVGPLVVALAARGAVDDVAVAQGREQELLPPRGAAEGPLAGPLLVGGEGQEVVKTLRGPAGVAGGYEGGGGTARTTPASIVENPSGALSSARLYA